MTDLFQAAPDQEPAIDENTDYLAELTGPGGKFDRSKYPSEGEMYKAIAKGKVLADHTLEIRNRQQDDLRQEYLKLREENTKQAKLEEMMQSLQQRLASSENTQANEDNPKQPTLDPDQLQKLVKQTFQSERQAERQQENFTQVVKKMKETWGTNYAATLEQKTEELGMTKEEVNQMATSRPNVFYKTFDLNEKPQQNNLFQSPIRSQQRSDSFAPSALKKRTWSYYQELKKANPNLYFDPKISVQMQQDAIELGDAFRDGDYYVKGLHEPL